MKSRKMLVRLSQVMLLVMFTTLSFGCLNMPPGEKGPGNYVKEERNVSGFSSLDVGGAFKVILTQGSTEKLIVEADAEEMDEIITEVVGNRLKIHTKSSWVGNFHNMTIYLTFISLKDINFSGAVEVESQGPLSFEELDLEISGAAEISLNLTAVKLDAEFSGASEIEFSGKCNTGYLEVSGASEINAENIEFTDLVLELSGASEARVNATGELRIDASGASSVRYKGGAKLTVNSSGASSVKQL
jgi:hypothetical protein